MKTLLMNPPSFENFDGGAGSRWPARREITSFWYLVWLTYPAGMIRESRLLDAPSHGVTPQQTIDIAMEYDFAVIFTSTPGFANDVRLAEAIKAAKRIGKVTVDHGDTDCKTPDAVAYIQKVKARKAEKA